MGREREWRGREGDGGREGELVCSVMRGREGKVGRWQMEGTSVSVCEGW